MHRHVGEFHQDVRPANPTCDRAPVPTKNTTSKSRSSDQVDALGLIGQLLDQMVPGMKPREPVKPKGDSGYRPIGLDERPLDWLVF